jgi:hypothetical protein
MLPIGELSELREVQELALPDTCTIQTTSQTNAKGSVTVTPTNTYTNVPCRIAAVNPNVAEREIGAALAVVSAYVLTVAFDQVVSATDRVVHGGLTYEVTACPNGTGSWRTAKRVYLKMMN